jgi:hypothetical protein
MKTFQFNRSKIFALGIACSLAASATTQAGAGGPDSAMLNNNSRLVVHRIADFGTLIFLDLFIDGVHVTTLGLNQGYEAVVRPGEHTLTVGTTPSPTGHTKFNHRKVTFRRGETYAFTALWECGDRCILETGDRYRASPIWWY